MRRPGLGGPTPLAATLVAYLALVVILAIALTTVQAVARETTATRALTAANADALLPCDRARNRAANVHCQVAAELQRQGLSRSAAERVQVCTVLGALPHSDTTDGLRAALDCPGSAAPSPAPLPPVVTPSPAISVPGLPPVPAATVTPTPATPPAATGAPSAPSAPTGGSPPTHGPFAPRPRPSPTCQILIGVCVP